MPRLLADVTRLLEAAFPVHMVLDGEGVVCHASDAAREWLGAEHGQDWRTTLTLVGGSLLPGTEPEACVGRAIVGYPNGRPGDRVRVQIVPAGHRAWAVLIVPSVSSRAQLASLSSQGVALAAWDPTLDLLHGVEQAERGRRVAERAVASLREELDVVQCERTTLEQQHTLLQQRASKLETRLQTEVGQAQPVRDRLELLGQLAGSITHDFNNLLVAILGHASVGLDHATQPEAVEALRGVHEAAERAAALTARVLTLGSPSVEAGPVDSVREIKQIAGLLRRLLSESVRLDVEVDARHAWVPLDRSRLEQILVNLAVNSRDAMPSGGIVRISVHKRMIEVGLAGALGISPGPGVCVRVTDTGDGMPPEVAERVFDPFYSTKGAGRGTGLGLSTVQRLVQEAGGAIQLSTQLGRGTTFSVWFPEVAAARVEPGLEALGRIPAGEGRVVLLVEDDAHIRRIVARMLSREGLKVVEAEHVEQALERCPPVSELALVITDQNMPGGTGMDLIETLRERRPGVPCVLMSGNVHDDAMRAGAKAGRYRVLAKPFDKRTFKQTVQRCLARSRLRLLDEGTADPPTMPSWIGQAS